MRPLIHSFAAAHDLQFTSSGEWRDPRPACVAGSFYPAHPAALTGMMDQMLAHVSSPPVEGAILAAVVPHAGYSYSGPVAAHVYAALKERRYARVVVIAPSHYEAFGFSSVYDGDAYATPLGVIPVDTLFAQRLTELDPSIRLSSRGHHATAHGAEHALEVQLPWLQHVLGDFTLVPIVMGDQRYQSSRALAVALARMLHPCGRSHVPADPQRVPCNTLIVASSDLSHYHTYNEAVQIDRKTLDSLQVWDYCSMSRNFEARIWEACGGAPIVAAMMASERMGANQADVLQYANSGDVVRDRSRVVGYGAAVFVKSTGTQLVETPFTLSEDQKNELLQIARLATEHAVRDRHPYEPQPTPDEVLNQERGVFVTLTHEGILRGCIGYTSAVKPLYLTVRDAAGLAALRDPRFPPVSAAELPKLEYEISVLSPLRRVLDVQQIEIGKHGLLIKKGDREGLLLPQVSVEQHWDRTKFLEETCFKAGIRPSAWNDEETDIFSFTAIVFGEHKQTHRSMQ